MGLFEDALKDEKPEKKPPKKKTVLKKKPQEKTETVIQKEPTIIPTVEDAGDDPRPKKSNRKKNSIALSVIDNPGSSGDIQDLMELAMEAECRHKIAQADLTEFKAEKEKLSLMNNAGDVMETSFGEFLYYGFIEKLYFEHANLGKKLLPILEGPVKENNLARVIEIIEDELESILEETKKAQKKDVRNWRKELMK